MRYLVYGAVALLGAFAATPAAAERGELRPMKGAVTAADFAVRDLDGKPVRFAALHGRVVLLNFWATWCPPCRKEMPSMERLYQAYKDRGLVVVALAQDQASAKEIKVFSDALKLSFPVWHDRDGLVGRQYSIPGVPTTFLIGRDGRIAYRVLGEYEWDSDEARRAVERLLGTQPPV